MGPILNFHLTPGCRGYFYENEITWPQCSCTGSVPCLAKEPEIAELEPTHSGGSRGRSPSNSASVGQVPRPTAPQLVPVRFQDILSVSRKTHVENNHSLPALSRFETR